MIKFKPRIKLNHNIYTATVYRQPQCIYQTYQPENTQKPGGRLKNLEITPKTLEISHNHGK